MTTLKGGKSINATQSIEVEINIIISKTTLVCLRKVASAVVVLSLQSGSLGAALERGSAEAIEKRAKTKEALLANMDCAT